MLLSKNVVDWKSSFWETGKMMWMVWEKEGVMDGLRVGTTQDIPLAAPPADC